MLAHVDELDSKSAVIVFEVKSFLNSGYLCRDSVGKVAAMFRDLLLRYKLSRAPIFGRGTLSRKNNVSFG